MGGVSPDTPSPNITRFCVCNVIAQSPRTASDLRVHQQEDPSSAARAPHGASSSVARYPVLPRKGGIHSETTHADPPVASAPESQSPVFRAITGSSLPVWDQRSAITHETLVPFPLFPRELLFGSVVNSEARIDSCQELLTRDRNKGMVRPYQPVSSA